MTAKRDLKKRIRERKARTGERYTTARAHVLRDVAESGAGQPPADRTRGISVIELEDLSEKAAAIGIRCQVLVHPELAARVDRAALLASTLQAVLATADDLGTESFRALILHGAIPDRPRGEMPDLRPPPVTLIDPFVRFVARAQAGVGGLSPDGHVLAFHMVGREGLETILCTNLYAAYALTPAYLRGKPPGLLLSCPPAIWRDAHELMGYVR